MLRHRTAVTTMSAMTINRNHLWTSWHVIRDTTTVERKTLESKETLTNLSIRCRINLAALGITKEIVQGIIVASTVVKSSGVLSVDIPAVVRVVDWTAIWRSGLIVTCVVSGVGLAWMTVGSAWSRTGVHGSSVVAIISWIRSFASRSLSVTRVLALVLIWGSKKDGIIGVSLDMLLQILRTLEGLAAEVALVWLQWDVNTDVRGDVITLDSGGSALVPSTGQV